VRWPSIVGDAIFFSPAPLLLVGWVKWLRVSVRPRGWRQNVVVVGLGSASVSCLCLFSVVLYLQKAHIGYWNEYVIASRWGVVSWPISVVTLILAMIGKGASRVLLLLAGAALVLVWTMAFIH
jgi:hypothetical protein